MKKLLVILLLLFPVHGAWAEIVSLQCVTKENEIILTYRIDTNKKIVKNNADVVVGKNLIVTENSFHWKTGSNFDETMRKRHPQYKSSTVDIDRISGQMIVIINEYNEEQAFSSIYSGG